MVTGPHRPNEQPPGFTGPFPPAQYGGHTGPHRPVQYQDDGYDDYYDEPPGAGLGLVIVVSALVSAITVVTLFLVLSSVTGGGKVTVPAMVGQSVNQARISAENARLTFVVAGKTHDPVIQKDHVALQSPLAGSSATAGTMVAVTLSRGPSKVTLPSLGGLTLSTALERLKGLGLELGETSYQPHATVAAGYIITTVPGPGTIITPGTRIKLVVARGPKGASRAPAPAPAPATTTKPRKAPASGTVSVPRVKGVRLRFARPRLRAKGLRVVRLTYREDEDHMEEMVLQQSPPSGTSVPRGTSVDMVINRFSE